MTAKEARRDLPDVPVKIGRKTFMARTSGRLNQFATVTVSYIQHAGPKEHLRGAPWHDAHFSWDAVALAVTTGNPLTFG